MVATLELYLFSCICLYMLQCSNIFPSLQGITFLLTERVYHENTTIYNSIDYHDKCIYDCHDNLLLMR